jgi:hypothetical protein
VNEHHRHHRGEHEPDFDPGRSPFDQPHREHDPGGRHAPIDRPVEHVTAAALMSSSEYLADISRYLHRIGVLAEHRDTPADLRTIVLTAAASKYTDQVGNLPARSIGIVNPSPVPVWLSIGGAMPTAQGRALGAPATSYVVYPVSAGDLEIAADPVGLAAGDAVVYLMRFASVQPPLLGNLA